MRRIGVTGRAASPDVDGESLVLRYHDRPSDEIRTQVFECYAGLVERLARKYAGIEPLEDLAQVGFIGLLNALKKFDPKAGVRFATYATCLVNGEIKHYLRDRSQIIRHPAWLQELRHRVNRSAGYLQQQLGRTPTAAEVAQEIGVAESSVLDVFNSQDTLRIASLDTTPSPDEDGEADIDRLDAADFSADQLSVEDRLVLEQAMKQLRTLEREVLVLFHFQAMNQAEIATTLNISSNYVSHILRQSLAKLRKILVAENERDRVLRRQVSAITYDVLDPATGAYTEAFCRARLEEEVHRASCEDGAVGVVLVNFAGISTLRTYYGEPSVQAFLSDAAAFIRGNVRRLDIVCRFGDSGFAIILPGTGISSIVPRDRLVAKLREWMQDRYTVNSPIQVEVGHGSYPCDGKSARQVLRVAQPLPVFADAA